jgi:hypothetical protein
MAFKLKLLGQQTEHFTAGLVISAYTIVDGAGNTCGHANTRKEADLKYRELQAQHPDKRFFIT